MISGPCEASEQDADAANREPRFSAGDGRLEVFCEATVAAEPRKGTFDHPTFRLGLEGSHTLRPGDDLDGPLAEIGDGIEQLVTAVDAIGKDVPQLGKRVPERLQQRHRAVIVLNVGRMHLSCEQRAVGIGDDVALTSLYLLGHVKSGWTATLRGLDAFGYR